MSKVIKRDKARFRIQIYDLKVHKSKTISMTDGKSSLEDIYNSIIDCLNRHTADTTTKSHD